MNTATDAHLIEVLDQTLALRTEFQDLEKESTYLPLEEFKKNTNSLEKEIFQVYEKLAE